MVEYFNFFSLHKTQNIVFDFFLPDTLSLEVCSAVTNLRENTGYQEKVMIGRNLIVEKFKNVILMDSFCSTGDLQTNTTSQEGAIHKFWLYQAPVSRNQNSKCIFKGRSTELV